MPSHAAAERVEFARSLRVAEPSDPTLCPPWKARDLAAHIVLRGRSPTYLATLNIPWLSERASDQQSALAADLTYAGLVDAIAAPRRWAPTRIGAIDDALNLIEYVTHHEDLRRAAPQWAPRILPADRIAAIWAHLRTMARTVARPAVAGLRLVPDDLDAAPIEGKAPMVTVRGDVVELMLVALGRARAARIELEGTDEDVAAFEKAQRMA